MFLSSSFPDLFWFLAFKFLCLPAPVVRGRRSSQDWQVGHADRIVASPAMTKQPTTLGAFSVSLAVKNSQASQAFYEKLVFAQVFSFRKFAVPDLAATHAHARAIPR